MENKIEMPLDYAPLHKNRFLVFLSDENYGLTIYDTVSLNENEKKLYLNVRINEDNIKLLSYVEKIKHRCMPRFLINKNHFTDIELGILNAFNNRIGTIFYKDCVLRKVFYPSYTYSCDDVVNITLEFSYAKKEINTEVKKISKERIPLIISSKKSNGAIPSKKSVKKTLKEKLISEKKCLTNSNQMLSENLKLDDNVINHNVKKQIKNAIADNTKQINEINELLEH